MNGISLVLILESIPEAFMLISLGLALYGYNINKKLTNILIAAIIYAFLTQITRNSIELYHLRTIINTIFLLLVILAIKIKPVKALLASFTSIIILLFAESLLVLVVTNITQQPLETLLQNMWLQIFLPWPHIILLVLLAFYLSRKNFSLLKVTGKFTEQVDTKRSAAIYLAVLVLFLAVILGIINIGIISGKSVLGKLLNERVIFIITALIAIDIYLMFGVIGRLFRITEQKNLIQAQEIYLKSLEEIMDTLQSQRHDFINHLEVIYALHCEENYTEEAQYLEKILGDIGQVNSIVQIDNPPLGALLNTKRAIAEAKGITMEISVDVPLKDLPIDTFILVKILGNIINNAMDAVSESEDKRIELEIERFLDNYVINVFNTGPVIDKENSKRIFEKGFTTKDNSHQGIGLFAVKEIVERHGGEIKVKSTPEKGTIFTIILPVKRT